MKNAKSGRKKREVDLQEVTCPDLSCVVAEKRAPLLPSWRLCANRPHVLLDGPLVLTIVYNWLILVFGELLGKFLHLIFSCILSPRALSIV
jgi:hypothetical protein